MEVVARTRELAALEEFLAAPPPAILVLEGTAGVGKTTLWEAAIASTEAAGRRVLRARPVQSEAQLSYVAVADLLEPLASDVVPRLPEPLRRALEISLLHAQPQREGELAPRAVGAATAAALALLAEEGPLVLAVDDVHWLDAASSTVLGYVLRRLEGKPVHVLLAERPGEAPAALALDRAPVEGMLTRLAIGPMSLGALQRLLVSRLGTSPSRPALRRLHQASGGNPFHALELARLAITGHVPEAALAAVRHRLGDLPGPARRALTHAALLSAPDLETLHAALGEDPVALLEPAVERELVIVRRGRVTFTHPLYASAVVADVADEERRSAHRVLAETARTEEERARHLALATAAADPAVAERLEAAAVGAAARGAAAAAADLAAEAVRVTPATDAEAASRRSVLHGMMTFVAGDSEGAERILAAAVATAPAGDRKAAALGWLGRVQHLSRSLDEAVDTYRAGIAEASGDPALRAELHEGLAWAALLRRRDLPQAAEDAALAVAYAREAEDSVIGADALSALFQARFLLGDGYPEEIVAAALATRRDDFDLRSLRILRDPRMHRALVLLGLDRLDEARAAYEEALGRALAGGDEGGVPFVLMRLSQALHLGGDLPAARACADKGLRVALDARQRPREASLRCFAGLYAAYAGDLEPAREQATRGLALAAEMGDGIARRGGAWALGLIDLLEGRPQAALEHLEPLYAESVEAGIVDPGENRHFDELQEALTATGRVAEAEELALARLELGSRLERPSAQASAHRGLARVASARGDHDEAVEHARAALALVVSLPLDVARSRLVHGAALRRARRRREAREELAAAEAAYWACGAMGFARVAQEEMARLGGRPAASGELTPAERAVAELVAAGRTNREAAAALFVTDRTVETHLSRVYAKLNVRSRAELAARFHPAA